ncbi:4-phosphoerythronate dehydrogenase PdxB [Pseudomonas putida]
MLIVADENIPLLEEFFAGFGEIRRVHGRKVDAEAVRDADVLLVRSITKVDRALLAGSNVRFVGTCTIGTDHLDLDYFTEAGIRWSSAPGCNARGVVDYVLSALVTLAELEGVPLAHRSYGVVGAGQVGSRLIRVLRDLGWDVKVCDPVRQAAEGGDYVSLDTLIEECDVISLHTPLNKGGSHPTWHLLDAGRLARVKPGTWLINAARGPVIDNLALKDLLIEREDVQAVLDVWEHEPSVDGELADLCVLATPHIAGYSLDGRQRGTAQIYQAYCAFRGEPPVVQLSDLLPPRWLSEVALGGLADPALAMAMLCRAVYDPRQDDANFRRSLTDNDSQQRQAFDALRKQYPTSRREIEGLRVRMDGYSPDLRRLVAALGCELV